MYTVKLKDSKYFHRYKMVRSQTFLNKYLICKLGFILIMFDINHFLRRLLQRTISPNAVKIAKHSDSTARVGENYNQ